MKSLFFFLCFSSLLCFVFVFCEEEEKNENAKFNSPNISTTKLLQRQNQFVNWMTKHQKSYHCEDEQQKRFEIWLDNLEMIERHNEQNLGYTLAMNEQGDLSWEEFSSFYLQSPQLVRNFIEEEEEKSNKIRISDNKSGMKKVLRDQPPAEFDWRNKKVVTPVKNQAKCGSCWAFGSIAVIESAWALAGHPLVSLSEGQLVDCTRETPYYNHACCGGWFTRAWDYVEKNGITGEISYPYLHDTNKCVNETQKFLKCNLTTEAVAKISGYETITPRDENLMLSSSYTHGPIVVTMHVNQTWRFYSSGVYDGHDCNTYQLNHNPVIVGWGKDNSTGWDYWILKNSWGPTWGLGGYIKMRRGINQCGLAERTGYVEV